MNNKRIFATTVSGLLLAIAGLALGQDSSQLPVLYRPNGTTFTIEAVKRQYGPDESLGPQQHITFSAGSNGTTIIRTRKFLPDGTLVADIATLRDRELDTLTIIEHLTQSTVTQVLGDQLPDSPIPDVANRASDTATILGHTAYKIESEFPGPTSNVSLESWVAPSLDMYPLRTVITTTVEAGVMRNEMGVTSVIPSTLPQEAFQIPPNYTERIPSDLAGAMMARLGYDSPPESQTAEWDARYFKRLLPSTFPKRKEGGVLSGILGRLGGGSDSHLSADKPTLVKTEDNASSSSVDLSESERDDRLGPLGTRSYWRVVLVVSVFVGGVTILSVRYRRRKGTS